MIDVSVLPLYLTAVMALLLIPGPDMLLITSASLSYGRRVGVWASMGNATSGVILTLLAAMGVSALVAMSPVTLEILRLVGAAYLLRLGWGCLRQGDVAEAETLAPARDLARQLYRRAVFSNLLNPKALLFFVLFLPQFVSTHVAASSGEQMLVLGLLLNIAGLLFNLILVAAVGSVGQALLNQPKFRRYQNKVMGGVFVLLALWLLSAQIVVPN
ncbi:lysine transporter LysE [Shewanella sp. NFH-SH190041]|uniref:LysE family translocator n=1 Tax=Shewanella sp. NFH-SH190041 TaxID=2950245 RepID=UPI0021C41FC4|nr:LysE family translocator [Shewanella sp. NFH-SH190041]BDM63381.1 lysine transporter LysE [Shewanella sp. NFH-SH190041]